MLNITLNNLQGSAGPSLHFLRILSSGHLISLYLINQDHRHFRKITFRDDLIKWRRIQYDLHSFLIEMK